MGQKIMILVVGAYGQLGSEVQKVLKAKSIDFFAPNSSLFNITNLENIRAYTSQHDFECIINCSAYTNVEQAEVDQATYTINRDGVANLATLANETKAQLIHVSTDYVFDGKGETPYLEEDSTNPINAYGKSKDEGEKYLLEHLPSACIVRTSWLYSSHHNNFVLTMKKLMSERDELSVVTDQLGSPTLADDLADFLVFLSRDKSNHGIYHFSNLGTATWLDFAAAVRDELALTCKLNGVPTSFFNHQAARPEYSVLSKDKIINQLKYPIKEWKESLSLCLKQLS